MEGWIKLHRKLFDHWIFSSSECTHLWLYLLMRANHKPTDVVRGRSIVELNPGQLITGRKQLAAELKINEHKIDRTLKLFESEQLIEQQAFPKYRVITVTKWKEHQVSEQQLSNKRAASEPQVSTDKNEENEEIKEVVDYLNSVAGKSYRSSTKKTRDHIKARLNDGFTVADMKRVIDTKSAQWKGTDMDRFLRPETLFAGKFEGYLNENPVDREPGIRYIE